jgi:acylphosphatase
VAIYAGGAERAIRRAYLISGRVQGVGFRWWTRREALALGLRGTVGNLPDGRVRVDAEGPPTALQRLLDLLHEGPPAARVARVDVVEPQEGSYPADFQTY